MQEHSSFIKATTMLIKDESVHMSADEAINILYHTNKHLWNQVTAAISSIPLEALKDFRQDDSICFYDEVYYIQGAIHYHLNTDKY